MDPKTTTRRFRNRTAFAMLPSYLPEQSPKPIEVIEVGAGMAVKYLGRIDYPNIPGGEVLRRLEGAVRRIPMPISWFESYETQELLDALAARNVRLTVMDVNPDVLNVVKRISGPRPVETVRADLSRRDDPAFEQLSERFDVLVSFNVIGRIHPSLRDTARANMRRLVRPGGIVLANGGIPTPDYEMLDTDCDLALKPLAVRGSAGRQQ